MLVTEIFPLEEHVDFPEARSVHVVPMPALAHQLVDVLGTILW